MRSKKLEVKISKEMLGSIDQAAAQTMQTRSAFIRETLALRLRGMQITKTPNAEDDLDKMIMAFLPEDHPLKRV